VTDPGSPVRLLSTRLTLRPDAITKIRWQAPTLAFLESGSGFYEIGFIDLQEMLIGFSLSTSDISQLPENGRRGRDANGDGDYVDADKGDIVPLPPRAPPEFFGKLFGLTPVNLTTQKVLDFDFASS